MIKNILIVGAGSFIGGALRYIISLLLKYTGGFPWATFIVNLLGCLIIGLLWGLFTRFTNVSQQLVLFQCRILWRLHDLLNIFQREFPIDSIWKLVVFLTLRRRQHYLRNPVGCYWISNR